MAVSGRAWLRILARLALGCIGLAPAWLAAQAALGGTWTVSGLSFSDELGGVRLLAVSGRGTRADPIVLIEEIAGPGPGVLVVQNFRNGRERVSPARGFLSLSVVKVITNSGPWRWSGFDLELRTTPDDASVYTDGLSFDQPRTFQRSARADRFLKTVQEDEPFDRIRFDGGSVAPAQYLRLDFDIVDANGRPTFYLVQHPIVLLAERDPGLVGPRALDLAVLLDPPIDVLSARPSRLLPQGFGAR